MERRRSATQAGAEQRQQTDEGWWGEASRAEKANWLRAYYAEYGGQLVVRYASVQKCLSCYGEGSTPELDGNGKTVR